MSHNWNDVQIPLKIEMKKLENFRDKSLLLVTDFQREVAEDDKTVKIIKILKEYLELFKTM